MASGVTVVDDCLNQFRDLKLRKAYKYIIYTLSSDLKTIVVEKTSASPDYDTFLKDLPENECRWAVYDLEFKLGEGTRNKLLFISWSPDSAKIKSKMVSASSRDGLRRSLDGIAVEIQATAPDEVAYETVLDKATRGAR